MNAVIQVKPHVRQFLVTQCGEDPTNLRLIPELWKLYKGLMQKPRAHFDSKKIANYPEEIFVNISNSMFYRYGYELTKTNTVIFNNEVDKMIKTISRQYISIHLNFGVKQAVAARNFVEVFNFQNSLDSDTVAKDFYRSRSEISRNSFYNSIFEQVQKNFLLNLVQNGMISQYFIDNDLTLKDE